MRLGAIKYIIPFFFVYNPALLTHAVWWQVLLYTFFAVVGIFYLGSALEGYLWGVGTLRKIPRIPLIIGGLLTAFPEIITTLIGILILAVVNILLLLMSRQKKKAWMSSMNIS